MSDEQPTFKVTDRRLFNADGSLREGLPAEETKTPTTGAIGETSPPAEAAPAPSAETVAPAQTAQASPAAEPPLDELGEEPLPGEEDPASFINFVMSIASNAAASLGMMEHPVSGQRAVDLNLAHHWLDVLGMLQEKTKNNLHPQEKQALDGILADLRMQFVALTRAAQQKQAAGGGGFTAQDILGGK